MSSWFDAMTVRTKLLTLIFMALVGLLVVSAVALFAQRETMLLDRKERIQNLVETARNIVERYRTIGVIDLCVSFQTTPNSVRIISRK